MVGGAVCAGCMLTLFPSEGKPGVLPVPPFLALPFSEINSTCGAAALLGLVSDFLLAQDVIERVKLLPWDYILQVQSCVCLSPDTCNAHTCIV